MIKRTPLNRFLSMVLCLCMVLSLLPGIPLVANAAETEIETYAAERYMTIYFRNDWNWSQIKLYFWGSKTDTNPVWPGKSMTYYGASGGKNYYSLQVPTDVTGFIISGIKDDGSGTRDQSPDIKSGWYNGITYYMFWNNGNQVKSFNIRDVFACKHPNQQTVAGYAATCTKDGLSDGKKCTDCGQMVTAQKVIPATGHKFVDEVCSVCGAEQYVEVYFRNDWNWSEVSLYYWNSESVDNGWPGEAMTFYDNDGEFDYYVMKVPTDVAGIIIDGLKDDGSGELDQSPDIKSGWYDGIVYYMRWDNGNKVSSLNIADVKFPCKHLNQETVSGHDATCTGDGLTDGVKCSDCGETIKKQEVIPALGHNWNAATCTCPKTCSVCGVTEGENLGHSYDNDCDADCNTCGDVRDVPGHTDADNSGRCDSCRILMQPAKICFATASLEGNIAINFYTLLSDEVIADPDNAYMQFTMANDSVIKVLVSEAVYGELNGETYYMFTCSVNAKEMADDVICQFFYEGGSTAEITYNVKEYGNYIINNNDDASAKAMAQAMLNYGAASQLHFGHNTDNLANAELGTPDYSNVTIEGYNAEVGQGTELAKLYSASLILKSETTLRFFFKVDSSVENFTVMLNGEALEVNVRSGLHYVDVVGIAAKDLDKAVTLTINDGTTTADVSFNPMSYCQGVLNDTTGAFDAEMKDLVAALYLYNQAAKEYFKEG